ncbi:nitroreductase family protein [Paenibacillus spongiae]|uniref:Nitroreductase family protein n=1 Tax=Paenibacillus spongiae TaxID=2909671 RepID=A0ABY5SDM0_9BACL|nr:nitroreductase family protein [Paenibacillus spongiae]UVI30600.1 nitroreductase family protein [Paenibacillus spongiae]
MSTQLDLKQDYFTVAHQRRSIRQYDPNLKLSKEEIKEVLTEGTLAPSSSNLQPWRFLVIDDQAQKEKLFPIAYNQQQILNASAVIVLLGDLEWYKSAEQIYNQAIQAGFMNEESKQQLLANVNRSYPHMSLEKARRLVATDGGLVAMHIMLAAQAKGLATGPMGGFKEDELKAVFNISDRYDVVMLITIGKAVADGYPTVRYGVDDITSWNEMNR